MKFHVGWWLFGGALSSLICAGIAFLWLMWPTLTAPVGVTIVTVPFIELPDGRTLAADPRVALAETLLIITCFGALLGFFGWLIFRPRPRKS